MDTTSPHRGRRRALRGALRGALALALLLPVLVGCGSDKKQGDEKADPTTSSSTTGATTGDTGGTPLLGADGTPVTNPDGSVVTVPKADPGSSGTTLDTTGGTVPSGEGQYPCTLLTTAEIQAAFGFAFTAPQAPVNSADADTCTWIVADLAGAPVSQVAVSVLQQKHLKDGQTLPGLYDALLTTYPDRKDVPLSVGQRSSRVSFSPSAANDQLSYGIVFGRVLDATHVLVVGTVANAKDGTKPDVPDSAREAISTLTPKAYARL